MELLNKCSVDGCEQLACQVLYFSGQEEYRCLTHYGKFVDVVMAFQEVDEIMDSLTKPKGENK